jgi:enoyl-CoA hydratase/carnithine racemase
MTTREQHAYSTQIAEVDGPIGYLTLNRPARLNAINDELMAEMIAALGWLDAHPDLRVIILRGAGRAFSAGADLKELPGGPSRLESGNSWLARRRFGQIGRRLLETIQNMQAVTIAQVHGAAVGGGVLLMAACDLRVVATGTVMFIPEVDLGTHYSWGAVPLLLRELGPAITREIIMTCRRFTAEEALAWRWINRVTTGERLADEVVQLAQELAAKPSVPLALTKDHINAIMRVMSAGTTSYADGDLAIAMATEEEAQAAGASYAESRIGKTRRR